MTSEESHFQCSIVLKIKNEFRKEIDTDDFVIFAVPNGGLRNKRTAVNLKKEGVLAGVSDLIISYYGKVFFIEIKLPTQYTKSDKTGKKILLKKGYQTDTQRDFQKTVEHQKHIYRLIDTWGKFNEFVDELKEVRG